MHVLNTMTIIAQIQYTGSHDSPKGKKAQVSIQRIVLLLLLCLLDFTFRQRIYSSGITSHKDVV